MTKPRQQYYSFAHQTLPELFFYDPGKLIHSLETNGPEFPRYLWRQLEAYAQVEDDYSGLLVVELSEHEDWTLALLVLPPPEIVTETHFIALVYREDPANARYLTLEYSQDLQGQPTTVFAEWSADAVHLNHGGGPAAEKKAFLERVKQEISKG